jgi:MoxR-like ATPase
VADGVAVQQSVGRVLENISRVIVGKRESIEQVIIALLCNGHALIEDVPGVGKTTLARSLARSTGCSFKRIQFTPDLLPSDLTGFSFYNQKLGEFEFRPGPLMAQIVLSDEINRATPKTQSALLEAMEEHQITVDGVSHPLPQPFLVLATQNPIEYEGTFPLPEGQLDRFFLRIRLGYPDYAEELTIIERQELSNPIHSLESVLSPGEVLEAQQRVKEIFVDRLVKQYIVTLVAATRAHSDVALGASPRGSLNLFRTSQALALLHGRDYVLPDDVKALAGPALAHRIILNPQARMRGVTGEQVVALVLEEVPVPGLRSPVAESR